VDLRQAWEGEATAFTPWLAQPENIKLLSETVRIELEVESQEKNVGPFRADILCKDTATGHYALIENQLERTDHIHLGQLVTYAAGLDAVTIIWIAAKFTDEHRAALDWLNKATPGEINFFGLEIELWRIGGSPMAPKFNVISQPNDWTETVAQQAGAASGPRSDIERLHLEFWTQFRAFLGSRGSKLRVPRPAKESWVNVPLGRSNFVLSAWNNMRDRVSGVQLELTGPDAKAYYGLIEQRMRTQVEERLSRFGRVEWRPLPNRQVSQVGIQRVGLPNNPETWSELDRWMADVLEAMHALFSPIVKSLDAGDYGTGAGPSMADVTGSDRTAAS
jgi:hypothetical protein